MLTAMAFKVSKNGAKHILAGRFDDVPSLCGSTTYRSVDPNMEAIGERMPLDDLIHSQQGFCRRCIEAAAREVESENAYLRK